MPKERATFRFDPELLALIKAEANRRHVTQTTVITDALVQYFENLSPKIKERIKKTSPEKAKGIML